eukprot:1151750-Pelagomonas_calceolata.AAC.8
MRSYDPCDWLMLVWRARSLVTVTFQRQSNAHGQLCRLVKAKSALKLRAPGCPHLCSGHRVVQGVCLSSGRGHLEFTVLRGLLQAAGLTMTVLRVGLTTTVLRVCKQWAQLSALRMPMEIEGGQQGGLGWAAQSQCQPYDEASLLDTSEGNIHINIPNVPSR